MKKLFLFLMFFIMALAWQAWAGDKVLRMATTTSTDNTGLLDYLAPMFEKDTGIKLQWIAVGTGKALRLGQNCDVDILLVHAPAAEKKFVAAGYGINRREVMYNDFVIVGPQEDPAGIKGLFIKEALQKIAAKKATFVSRGDDSGTNKKELALWKMAGIDPKKLDKEPWYIQTGQGMLATLNVAAEKKGYTLTDRGTYIKFEYNHKGKPPLVILVEGDKALRNQYSVIEINPKRCPNVRNDLARAFSDWITSPKAQKAIAEFKLLGKQLFIPEK
ncbi:substrate-binding domain-containing protein [Thermodesulfatator autotrophicus]|uniref:Tungsten ABC transporter substrate-binding protein n=1 Tax=Thermodesulfatator autotrophicus TaxID=1795632 RepID=A0A177E4U5_9BACT|nr:substrate-binding domain-containing protein [Thermodesulfatator autotrophicus]OAG26983.1 tungsten ABC transporter substrate-binding protein [Thermodesulfatator autotrophicus]